MGNNLWKTACTDWDSVIALAEKLPGNPDITSFIEHLKDTNIKPGTAKNYVSSFYNISKTIRDKPISEATPEDIQRWKKETSLSRRSLKQASICMGRFYKHVERKDLLPALKIQDRRRIKESDKLDLDTVPTRDEIAKIIRATAHPRDAAIIALLADTGLRAHELLTLRTGDLDMDAPVPTVRVSAETKTGQRIIPIIPYHNAPAFSPPELAVWLSRHPSDEAQAPLWPTYGYGSDGGPLNYHALRMMIEKAYRRAGIRKTPRPHKFRDYCAMERAVQLTDAELEAFMGWTENSKMRKRYTTAAGVRARLLERANQIAGVEPDNPKIKEVPRCWRCREPLPTSARYCPRCATPQDTTTKKQDIDEMELQRQAAQILNSPQLLEKVLQEKLSEIQTNKK